MDRGIDDELKNMYLNFFLDFTVNMLNNFQPNILYNEQMLMQLNLLTGRGS